MDMINQKLLNRIQKDFPITSYPFREIAHELGISESEVLLRIGQLKDAGFIRRIGGIFDSKVLGYKSTLCAMRVPEERIEEVASIVNGYPGVTHNYLRNHEYNMWFTLIAPSAAEIEATLCDLRIKGRIDDLMNLPSINMYKINVNFEFKEAE